MAEKGKKSEIESGIPKKYLDVAEGLKAKHGEVTVLYVKKRNGEDSVVYLAEPRRHQKMAIIDEYLSTKAKTQAGALLIESCMIAEVSDKSILAENTESDKVWLAMCMKAMAVIDFYDCELKKN